MIAYLQTPDNRVIILGDVKNLAEAKNLYGHIAPKNFALCFSSKIPDLSNINETRDKIGWMDERINAKIDAFLDDTTNEESHKIHNFKNLRNK